MLWMLYLYYEDVQLIARYYSLCEDWFKVLLDDSKNYTLNNGLGDWDSVAPTPLPVSGTGWFYWNAILLANMSSVLGMKEKESYYDDLAQKIRDSFNQNFVDDHGRVGGNAASQYTQSFALYLDLLPSCKVSSALKFLLSDIMVENKGHLSTGIFGTKLMFSMLYAFFQPDVAFTIKTQETYPSYGYMLLKGATTLWETWFFSDNVYSNNHAMFGSIVESFYKNLAGIAPHPLAKGFDYILIHPQPPFIHNLSLPAVSAVHHSIRGDVSSNWKLIRINDSIHFLLDLEIPVNTIAEVWIPTKNAKLITTLPNELPIKKILKMESITKAIYIIGSGKYHFESVF
jgi:alpha-L-rhamnosidase